LRKTGGNLARTLTNKYCKQFRTPSFFSPQNFSERKKKTCLGILNPMFVAIAIRKFALKYEGEENRFSFCRVSALRTPERPRSLERRPLQSSTRCDVFKIQRRSTSAKHSRKRYHHKELEGVESRVRRRASAIQEIARG